MDHIIKYSSRIIKGYQLVTQQMVPKVQNRNYTDSVFSSPAIALATHLNLIARFVPPFFYQLNSYKHRNCPKLPCCSRMACPHRLLKEAFSNQMLLLLPPLLDEIAHCEMVLYILVGST